MNAPNPSVLEGLAKKIEPTDAELKAAGKLPAFSRRARRLMTLVELAPKGVTKVVERTVGDKTINVVALAKDPHEFARSTGQGVQLGATTLVFYTDGSLRHPVGKLRGKAARKTRKRLRHK